MNMHNAREKQQLERMHQLKKERRCFFCDNNYDWVGASPALYTSPYWYIKKNDYPYKGSIHHYLIVPMLHVTTLSEITPRAWKDLHIALAWLEKKLKPKGYSVFVRSGNMYYTGATIDHLHFHFLSGGKGVGKVGLKGRILAPLGYKKK